jgi:hypothetical protein
MELNYSIFLPKQNSMINYLDIENSKEEPEQKLEGVALEKFRDIDKEGEKKIEANGKKLFTKRKRGKNENEEEKLVKAFQKKCKLEGEQISLIDLQNELENYESFIDYSKREKILSTFKNPEYRSHIDSYLISKIQLALAKELKPPTQKLFLYLKDVLFFEDPILIEQILQLLKDDSYLPFFSSIYANFLNDIFGMEKYSNVKILFNKTEEGKEQYLYTNKWILSNFSNYFKRLLKTDFYQEEGRHLITFKEPLNFSFYAFLTVIRCGHQFPFYSSLKNSLLLEIFLAADFLEMDLFCLFKQIFPSNENLLNNPASIETIYNVIKQSEREEAQVFFQQILYEILKRVLVTQEEILDGDGDVKLLELLNLLKTFNLQEVNFTFLLYSDRTDQFLSLIKEICSKITRLTIPQPHCVTLRSLPVFKVFSRLQHFIIERPPIGLGALLVQLPNLKILSVTSDYFYDGAEAIPPIFYSIKDNHSLDQLESFTICQTALHIDLFLDFLKKCPNLKELKLIDCFPYCDPLEEKSHQLDQCFFDKLCAHISNIEKLVIKQKFQVLFSLNSLQEIEALEKLTFLKYIDIRIKPINSKIVCLRHDSPQKIKAMLKERKGRSEASTHYLYSTLPS